MRITKFKQSCFQVQVGGKVLYFDPNGIPKGKDKGKDKNKDKGKAKTNVQSPSTGLEPADTIFISHGHFDHAQRSSIKAVRREHTTIYCPATCTKIVRKWNAKGVKIGDTIDLNGLKITAVPAYNLNKPFHKPKNAWLGYIVNDGERSLYHAGDTDLIPEMETFPKVDIAMLPIGGKFTMDLEEAVQATATLNPTYVLPMHKLRTSLDAFERVIEAKLPEVTVVKLNFQESFSPES